MIELGQLIAGPFCGQVLAGFGADVIKVEQPGQGDPMRSWGIVREGKSLSWNVIARGKRCVTADLRDPPGRDFVLALVAQADVVIENFRPGTMERFGLGYDALAAVNPGVVMTRGSGFGVSLGDQLAGMQRLSARWWLCATGTAPASARSSTSRSTNRCSR